MSDDLADRVGLLVLPGSPRDRLYDEALSLGRKDMGATMEPNETPAEPTCWPRFTGIVVETPRPPGWDLEDEPPSDDPLIVG